jgi:glycosyltransferase involved in cell wall biosynthesis
VKRVPYLLQLQKGFIMPTYLFSLIKQVRKNDCILINLPQMEGVLAAIVGRLFGKKVVSVYACEVSLPKSFVASVIELLLTVSHMTTLHLSHQVVALSDDYVKHTKLLQHFRHKTIGIYPYIQKPIITKKSSDKRMLTIGYIGRISSEKGLEYLLEAIPLLKKQLRDTFMVTIAGPKAIGEHVYSKKIETLGEMYKDFVSFIPPVADREMGNFYSSLDVLVLPSINSTEAFGMVQVEAMFCGTPVVCSDLPGVRVPIRETGMGEIAKKRDSEDLAEKIARVLKNRASYAAKKKIAEKVFDSEKVVEAYEKLIAMAL